MSSQYSFFTVLKDGSTKEFVEINIPSFVGSC